MCCLESRDPKLFKITIVVLMLWNFSLELLQCLFNERKINCLAETLISAVSSSNAYTKTFTGIDGAGKRLADEVKS